MQIIGIIPNSILGKYSQIWLNFKNVPKFFWFWWRVSLSQIICFGYVRARPLNLSDLILPNQEHKNECVW